MNSIVVLVGIFITIATGAPVALQLLKTHPRGLFILFFTEMWERFSYYGMRGLLVFYLTQHFLFEDKVAAAQYGSYATLVYLLPLVGGVMADRYLGARKAVAFGALLLVAGHLTMAVEGPTAQQSLTYGGAHYAFNIAGRGDSRAVTIGVAGRQYGFAQTPAGDFQIKGLAAGAPLPAVLPMGSFTLEKHSAAPIFEDVLYLALALIIDVPVGHGCHRGRVPHVCAFALIDALTKRVSERVDAADADGCHSPRVRVRLCVALKLRVRERVCAFSCHSLSERLRIN